MELTIGEGSLVEQEGKNAKTWKVFQDNFLLTDLTVK